MIEKFDQSKYIVNRDDFEKYSKERHVFRFVPLGEWLWNLADNGWAEYTCSVCGWKKNVDVHVKLEYNFCPNCGAMMKEGDEE